MLIFIAAGFLRPCGGKPAELERQYDRTEYQHLQCETRVYRITNPNTHSGRITNPAERPQIHAKAKKATATVRNFLDTDASGWAILQCVELPFF